MVTGKPPYPNEASDKDPYYRLIIQRKYSLFWQAVHHHTGQTFSAEFRDLINGMLAHRPTSRISIEEIQDHAWVRHKDVMSPDEVKSYMSKLRETNLAK
jgi:serine/threonine protein kinase